MSTTTNAAPKAKAPCAISRAEFRQAAQALECKLADSLQLAEAKEFSTGSLGWFANGKMPVKVGNKVVQVQIGLNLTIIGSKELPVD